MANLVKTGSLIASGVVSVAVGNMDVPFTATLKSANGGRKIELSSTGDESADSWWTPTVDATTAGMVNISVRSPVSHVRFTGAPGDVYRVQ